MLAQGYLPSSSSSSSSSNIRSIWGLVSIQDSILGRVQVSFLVSFQGSFRGSFRQAPSPTLQPR